MKLLTFAIPCYNSQDYMENCIKSLLPGGDDVEILIIDDGSKDIFSLSSRAIRKVPASAGRSFPTRNVSPVRGRRRLALRGTLRRFRAAGNRTGNLGNLQSMSQTGAVMVAFRRQKHLCLVFEPAEGLTMDNSVTVPLKGCTQFALLFRLFAAFGVCRKHCIRRHGLPFQCLCFFAYRHRNPHPFSLLCYVLIFSLNIYAIRERNTLFI